MPQISKNLLRKSVEKRMYQVFQKSISTVRNPRDVENFVNDLLTPTEKIMLAKRLAIAVLLEKGYEYRPISQTLKVSFATINAVIKQQLAGGEGYQKVVNRILRDEKLEEVFLELEKTIGALVNPRPGAKEAREARHRLKKEAISRRVI